MACYSPWGTAPGAVVEIPRVRHSTLLSNELLCRSAHSPCLSTSLGPLTSLPPTPASMEGWGEGRRSGDGLCSFIQQLLSTCRVPAAFLGESKQTQISPLCLGSSACKAVPYPAVTCHLLASDSFSWGHKLPFCSMSCLGLRTSQLGHLSG